MRTKTMDIRVLKKQRLADGTTYDEGAVWKDCPLAKAERLISRGEAKVLESPKPAAPVKPTEPTKGKEEK